MRRANRIKERQALRHRERLQQEKVAWTIPEVDLKTSGALDEQRRGILREAACELHTQEKKAADCDTCEITMWFADGSDHHHAELAPRNERSVDRSMLDLTLGPLVEHHAKARTFRNAPGDQQRITENRRRGDIDPTSF